MYKKLTFSGLYLVTYASFTSLHRNEIFSTTKKLNFIVWTHNSVPIKWSKPTEHI